MRRHAVMIPQTSDRSDARPMLLSPRRSGADQRLPLTACAGCGRPTRTARCRGCGQVEQASQARAAEIQGLREAITRAREWEDTIKSVAALIRRIKLGRPSKRKAGRP